MSDVTPAETLRKAAGLLKERAEKAAESEWPGFPWAVTECSNEETGDCPCIVYQGEYKPYTEAQQPGIQYVCDAEDPAFAEYIAAMGPLVAIAIADWLESAATDAGDARLMADRTWSYGYCDSPAGIESALKIARLYLGEGA
jgi:hypothetical protein